MSVIHRAKHLARSDAVLVMAGEHGALAVQLVVGVFIARALGAAGVGEYSTAVATANVLGVVACLGLPQAYSALTKDTGQQHVDYFRYALPLLVGSAMVFATVGVFALGRLSTEWLLVSVVLLPVYFPAVVLRPLFRNREYIRGQFRRLTWIPLAAAVSQGLCVLAIGLLNALTSRTAFAAFVASTAVRALLSTLPSVHTSKKDRRYTHPSNKASAVHALLRAGPPYLILSASLALQQQSPVLVMGLLGADDGNIGILSRVSQLTGVVLLILQALQPFVFHRWLGSSRTRARMDIRRLAIGSGPVFLTLTLVAATIGPQLMVAVYGEGFRATSASMAVCQIAAYPALILTASAHGLGASRALQQASISLIVSAVTTGSTYLLLLQPIGPISNQVLAMSVGMLTGNLVGGATAICMLSRARRTFDS